MAKTNEDILYTVAETAKLLKTNRARIYEYINKGMLPYLNIGGAKIRKSTINSFLRKNEMVKGADAQ